MFAIAPDKTDPASPQTLPQPGALKHFKRYARRIPGAQRLATHLNTARLTLLHGSGPARWLYRHDVVKWMYRPELRRQLPPAFRRFARFCMAQHWLGLGRVIGGEAALKRAVRCHTACEGADHVLLDLGWHKIALNLLDPRMLQAPNELLDPIGDTAILRDHLRPGDTFIDIGANHGSFAIAASKIVQPGGLIVAVEPQPRLGDLLELSLRANTSGRVELLRMACGDAEGSIDLFIPHATSGRAGVFAAYSGGGAHQRVTVPLRRFDDATDWRHFPGKVFVKLDIEGSEPAFLRGARRMIQLHHPRMLLEINPVSLAAAGSSVAQLRDLLIDLGYHHFIPADGHSPCSITDLGDRHVGNILIID